MANEVYENPFTQLYLAEQLVRQTEDTIQKGLLSPEVFKISELVSLITEPMNHFVIGVPGSGKTMALAFLRLECIAFINETESIRAEYQNVLQHIERGMWGIYHGLLLNEEYLTPQDFKGFGLSDETWTHMFGDFINVIFLKKMLSHLKRATEAPDHYISKWLEINDKKGAVNNVIVEFTRELDLNKECNTVDGLLQWTKNRLSFYQKLIKERTKSIIEISELPSTHFYKDIGYLPLKLVDGLRKHNVIGERQSVLFIIDEYDQCEYGNRRDFARAINSFVKVAARGPVSNVFVKVGSRPHGFYDTRVLGGEARIEDGRDYKAIDLMSILRNNKKIYSNLIKDIANRRISKTVWFQQRGVSDFSAILKDLEPLEEAELYRRGKADPDSHLKVLKDFCKPFDEAIINYADLAKRIKQFTTETLYQKYLVLEACRRLQRLKGKKIEVIKRGYDQLIKSLKDIAHFVKAKGTVKLNSKISYKLKDMREPSLFLLASEFNQQKYYCGFDTLRLMSEGIPLSFIKLCRAMFDEIGYRVSEFEKSKTVDCSWQNRVVRKVASDIRRQTMSDLCSGQSFLTLVDELGFIYRKMQLAPTAPYPTPNGFSIEKEIAWPSEGQANICEVVGKENNIELLKRILKDATDWGYLIELPHRSKLGSLKTRTKYYFNSMLSPYYDLSVRHLKEPLYLDVNDLSELLSPDDSKRTKLRSKILTNLKSLGSYYATLDESKNNQSSFDLKDVK